MMKLWIWIQCSVEKITFIHIMGFTQLHERMRYKCRNPKARTTSSAAQRAERDSWQRWSTLTNTQ